MRAFLAISASLVTALAVYLIPVAIELLLLRGHANPWLVCVLFADICGCALLLLLGFKRAAILVYAAAAVFEAACLSFGMPPHRLIWLTNVVPALVAGAVMLRIALRWLVTADQSS